VRRRVAQERCRLLDDARVVAARVDDRVPGSAAQGVEAAVAVTDQRLGLGEEIRVRAPAVEQRYVMPSRQRLLDDGAPEELRPAED